MNWWCQWGLIEPSLPCPPNEASCCHCYLITSWPQAEWSLSGTLDAPNYLYFYIIIHETHCIQRGNNQLPLQCVFQLLLPLQPSCMHRYTPLSEEQLPSGHTPSPAGSTSGNGNQKRHWKEAGLLKQQPQAVNHEAGRWHHSYNELGGAWMSDTAGLASGCGPGQGLCKVPGPI